MIRRASYGVDHLAEPEERCSESDGLREDNGVVDAITKWQSAQQIDKCDQLLKRMVRVVTLHSEYKVWAFRKRLKELLDLKDAE